METSKTPLTEIINKAEKEGKWLWSQYQGLPFSPKELREQNDKGRFRWGPSNWELIDPESLLVNEAVVVDKLRKENEAIRKRILNL